MRVEGAIDDVSINRALAVETALLDSISLRLLQTEPRWPDQL
jgi:hypothetical protein